MVQEPKSKSFSQANENLARPMEDIRGVIRGRGVGRFDEIGPDCICNRPYSNIMCLNCGHLMFGRVRYGCPKHKMVTFLIDITNCPKCRAFEYMLEEFMTQEFRNGNVQNKNNNQVIDQSYKDEEEDEDEDL